MDRIRDLGCLVRLLGLGRIYLERWLGRGLAGRGSAGRMLVGTGQRYLVESGLEDCLGMG